MDNKEKVGTPDKDKININEEYEVSYWSKKWGVKPHELKNAVERVGTSVKDVQIYLNK